MNHSHYEIEEATWSLGLWDLVCSQGPKTPRESIQCTAMTVCLGNVRLTTTFNVSHRNIAVTRSNNAGGRLYIHIPSVVVGNALN